MSFQSINNRTMKTIYRIFFEGESGYVVIGTRRMSMDDAVELFSIKMANTLKAMEDGRISKAITMSVKEIKP